MRIVAFADVQGNPHAAAAILTAAKRIDDATTYCLGNAVGPGPDPASCIEKLRKAHVVLVRGERDAAALSMPGGDEKLRLEGKAILSMLKPADVGYLREASPPRRMVAGGKRILLTSDAKSTDVGAADVVIHPGVRAVVRLDGTRLDVSVGSAIGDEHGESPFVVYDTQTQEAKVHHAAWDRTVLRKNRYGESTRHL